VGNFSELKVMWILCLLPLLLQSTTAVKEVSSAAYQALSAQAKADRLWSNCLEDKSSAQWFHRLAAIFKLITQPVCPVFRAPGDELAKNWNGKNRVKSIHPVGVVGKVQWKDLGGHPYSGIFKGAKHGLARLSLALEPETGSMTTAPGIGLKFLRDGVDSANLVAMFSVGGQESWNFFKNDFSNHIPGISLSRQPLAAKFATATRNIRQVGISDWGRFGENGVEIKDPNFPYRLRFHPTGNIRFPDNYVRPVTEDLVTIPSGSVLYQVYALDVPEELGGKETRIADLVLTSKMVTSKWGDQHLFFRHQDMAEDLRLRPQWNKFTPQWAIFLKDPNRPSPCNGWHEGKIFP